MKQKEQAGSLHQRTEAIPNSGVSPRTRSMASHNERRNIDDVSLDHVRPSIALQIDELVLHGFEQSQRHTIAHAMEYELTRLLTEHGAPVTITNSIDVTALDVGVINIVEGSSEKDTGNNLARMIYGGLGR